MSYKNKSCLGLCFALLYPKYLLLQDFARKIQGLHDDEISLVKAIGMWVIEVSLAHVMTAFLERPQARLMESLTAHIRGLEHITNASHFDAWLKDDGSFFLI